MMNTMCLFKVSAACAVAWLAVTAHAQTNGTFLLMSSNTVSPATPTTTIEVWAAWDDPAGTFAFGGADYDLTAGDGIFSNPVNVLYPPGVLGTPGVTVGNTVTGALIGQLFTFPQLLHPIHNGSNPLLLATYDWTATDFTARAVALDTSNTSLFNVVNPKLSTPNSTQLYPDEFTPGAGVITVVPGPAAWLALGLPFVIVRRRRT